MQIKWLFRLPLFTFFFHIIMADESLYQPIVFTDHDFQKFVQHVYNHPCYANEVLPHSFDHLMQLLRHGHQTNQPRIYTKSAIRLFNNKLKATRYVQPAALIEFLDTIPTCLEYQFIIYKVEKTDQLKQAINEVLYNAFLQKYTLFEQDPHALFNIISTDIVDTIKSENFLIDDISMDELRYMLLTFLDQSINKLVWSPDDQIQTWVSVKQIAEKLEHVMEYNIIADPDDLNDLYISLIERYCYFLELMKDAMPTQVYIDIKLDIEQNTSSLLDLQSSSNDVCDKIKRIIYTLDLVQAEALNHNFPYNHS